MHNECRNIKKNVTVINKYELLTQNRREGGRGRGGGRGRRGGERKSR